MRKTYILYLKVLVSLSCYKKIPLTGWFKQQTFTSHNSEARIPTCGHQHACVLVRALFLACSSLLSCYIFMNKESSGVLASSLCKGSHCTRGSHPHDLNLITSQRPLHSQLHRSLRVIVSNIVNWGGNKQPYSKHTILLYYKDSIALKIINV